MLIVARGLERTYRTGTVETPVLRGVDLDVPEGSFAVLEGPSGSGKSTLLNLIGGLDAPDGGTLEVAGVRLDGATEAQRLAFRRDHAAWIFQFFHLIPVLTALENVQVVLEGLGIRGSEARERGVQALEQVGLAHLAGRLPSEMSGGEQQRVGVARALAKRTRLLLADEPTGSLDRRIGAEVVQLLRETGERTGTTMLVVTHDAQVVEAATHRFALEDGLVRSR